MTCQRIEAMRCHNTPLYKILVGLFQQNHSQKAATEEGDGIHFVILLPTRQAGPVSHGVRLESQIRSLFDLRPVAHVPILLVSAPAPISLLAPIPAWVVAHTPTLSLSGLERYRQFCGRWRANNMAPMWNRRFILLCLLHLRRRQRRNRRGREFWVHPIVAARTLEGTLYTLIGRLQEDERKFFNYFRMSTSTFDYILNRLAPHLQRQNTVMRECISPLEMLAVTIRLMRPPLLHQMLTFLHIHFAVPQFPSPSLPVSQQFHCCRLYGCWTLSHLCQLFLTGTEERDRRHGSDMSVVVTIMLSCRHRVQQGHKITWNLTTTDIGAGTDTDNIGGFRLSGGSEVKYEG
uniref:Uncharacterized protein n=1 Tax=Timema bartmani TaxID=61472 RepID=A0A7R9F507_9NEOP|nr:unnamed protein product [Timema bartmani]